MPILISIIIGLLFTLVIIGVSYFAVIRYYKYARPRRRFAKFIISGASILEVVVIVATFSSIQPPICTHPQPTGNVTCKTGHIRIDGSTALQGMINVVITSYEHTCKGSKIDYNVTDSQTGIQDLRNSNANNNNHIDIAASDVYDNSTRNDLDDHQIAGVIYTLVENPNVDVPNLSTEKLRAVFDGQAKNWGDVGGSGALPIVTVGRHSTSGTSTTFDTTILSGESEQTLYRLNKPSDVINMVQITHGAIGYVSLNDAENLGSGLPRVRIDGVEASPAHVLDGTYNFWNIEHLYTKKDASDLALAFVNYMGSDAALSAIDAHDFVRIQQMNSSLLAKRCS